MLLHDTVVIPATNVKALRSNILIQPAPHQEMNFLRMKEMKARRNRKETIAVYGGRGMSMGQTASLTDFSLGSCRWGLR